jgi:hypothetical protein
MKTKAAEQGYLTKRIVISASKRAFKTASAETMKVMGHTIIAKDGWIVKKYSNGDIEKLQKIEGSDVNQPLNLD